MNTISWGLWLESDQPTYTASTDVQCWVYDRDWACHDYTNAAVKLDWEVNYACTQYLTIGCKTAETFSYKCIFHGLMNYTNENGRFPSVLQQKAGIGCLANRINDENSIFQDAIYHVHIDHHKEVGRPHTAIALEWRRLHRLLLYSTFIGIALKSGRQLQTCETVLAYSNVISHLSSRCWFVYWVVANNNQLRWCLHSVVVQSVYFWKFGVPHAHMRATITWVTQQQCYNSGLTVQSLHVVWEQRWTLPLSSVTTIIMPFQMCDITLKPCW